MCVYTGILELEEVLKVVRMIFDIGIRGYKTHWVKILSRTRSWTWWSFWVPSSSGDSVILWMVNKRMVRNCEGCSVCPLYLLKNWILNMCPDETTWLWWQRWWETNPWETCRTGQMIFRSNTVVWESCRLLHELQGSVWAWEGVGWAQEERAVTQPYK